jgi:hypothetical protein
MEFVCPHCHSPIYSRKNKLCGVCEQPLPPELLMSPEQAARLKQQLAEEEKRAKAFNPIVQHDSHEPGIGGGFGI